MSAAAVSLAPTGVVLASAGNVAVLTPVDAAGRVLSARAAGRRVWASAAAAVEEQLGLPVGTLSDVAPLARSLCLPVSFGMHAGQLAAWLDAVGLRATDGQVATALADADTDRVWRTRSALGICVDAAESQRVRDQIGREVRVARGSLNVDPSVTKPSVQRWVRRLGVVTREDDGTPAIEAKTGLPKIGKDYRANASVPPLAAPQWDAFVDARVRAFGAVKLKEVANATVNGRVHPRIDANATVDGSPSATGRMSVSGPAVQNFPKAADIRGVLRAASGSRIVAADLRHVEPSIAAVMSGDARMIDAMRPGVDPYLELAGSIWHTSSPSVEQRDLAKVALLATLYGQGAAAFAARLRLPLAEALAVQAGIWATWPVFGAWARDIRSSRGPLTSIYGRTIAAPYKAHARVNYVVQGSGADVFKRMALGVAGDLGDAALLLPVHDELALEVPEADAQRAADVLVTHMTVDIGGLQVTCAPPKSTDRWTK